MTLEASLSPRTRPESPPQRRDSTNSVGALRLQSLWRTCASWGSLGSSPLSCWQKPVCADIGPALERWFDGRERQIDFGSAAGVTDGRITMYRRYDYAQNPAVASQASSIYQSKGNINPRDAFEAQQIDVIRFMRDLDRDIDIIKMDIEGAEAPILESLLKSSITERIHFIFVETHEFKVPELFERTEALRRKVGTLDRPIIHMNWH